MTLPSADTASVFTGVDALLGAQSPTGSTVTPASSAAIYGLAIDEEHARIYYSSFAALGAVLPPPSGAVDEIYFPVASSGAPSPGTTTQVVTWNRGTPDSTGATKSVNAVERLLPDGWITGWSPATLQTVDAGKLAVQADAVGTDMAAPGALGSMRVAADNDADTFMWSRVAVPAAGGGTLGAATNGIVATAAIPAGDSGFLFAPADPAMKTHAGVAVVLDATGTISIVDAAGQNRGTYAFDWPSGYRVQGTTIFDTFGLPALPSARIVCSVTTGSVLLFGTAYDPVSGDAIRLDAFRSGDVGLWPTLPGFTRGNGTAGTLQLFNPGTADAHVALSARPSQADGLPVPPSQPIGSVTVPAGGVVSVDLGAGAPAQGTVDLASDQSVAAFATYRIPSPGGGTAGYGVAAQQLASAVSPGSRGVFLAATANDAFDSTLQLVNSGFSAASVTVSFTAADGTAAGSRTVAVPAQGVVAVPGWAAGQTTDMGRVDVTPADSSAPVFAALLRRDRVSQDTDTIFPFVIPK